MHHYLRDAQGALAESLRTELARHPDFELDEVQMYDVNGYDNAYACVEPSARKPFVFPAGIVSE